MSWPTNLQTERLVLRPWTESDAQALFQYASDPDIGPRAGWPAHKTIEESAQAIRDVLSVPAIAANPPDRCYYCKRHIFSLIAAHAARDGFTAIADGTNASDDVASRPGFRALQELQVLSPLRACGITKAQIRHLAQQAGLPLADKPAYACLATRIPTGNPISAPVLALTERAEARMRALGFRNFRVRYLGGDAKLELSRSDFSVFYRRRDALYAALSEDYRHIYLDLKERADE